MTHLKSSFELPAESSIWRPSDAFITTSYFLIAAISLIPIATTRYPQSIDYLNHLGRMVVLTAPGDDPLRAFYSADWRLVPNLGLELLVLGLNQFLPIELAMKASWILIFLSLPLSYWFLYLSLNKRIDLLFLLSTLCFFNLSLTGGFLSFSLGQSATLAIVGLWFRFGEELTPRNLLALNLLSSFVLVLHVAALGELAFTIISLHTLRTPWRAPHLLRRAVVAGCGFIAPVLLLMRMSGEHEFHFPAYFFWDFTEKSLFIWKIVFSGNLLADGIGVTALILATYLAIRPGGARCDPRLAPTLIAWLVVLIVLPKELGRAAVIDLRLFVFPTLLLIASLRAEPSKAKWIASSVAVVAACVRVAFIQTAWLEYNADIIDFRSLGHAVEPGTKVLVEEAPRKAGPCHEKFRWSNFYDSAPVLFLIDRHAFVSNLFAIAGQHPIRFRDDLREAGESASRDKYDYLLVRAVNCAQNIGADDRLVFLGESQTYRLYKILPRTKN